MSHINHVHHTLVTPWGEWSIPEDLLLLEKNAPKIHLGDGDNVRLVPYPYTKAGKTYYARERELLRAIDIIESAGIKRVR